MSDPDDPRRILKVTDAEGREWCCGAYITRVTGYGDTQIGRLRGNGKLMFRARAGNEALFDRARELIGRATGAPPRYLYAVESVDAIATMGRRRGPGPAAGRERPASSGADTVGFTEDEPGDPEEPQPKTERDFAFGALLREFKDASWERDQLQSERDVLKNEIDRLKTLAARLTHEADERNKTLREYLGK